MDFVHNLQILINRLSIRGAQATCLLFLLFTGTIFITICLGHWFIYHEFMFRALWQQPAAFWGFMLPKISISLFFAFFVLLTRRKWWTAIVLSCCNVWIIANILYVRANNCVLTWDAILMAHNLHGFESSIGFYWDWSCTFLVVLSILYSLCLVFIQPQPTRHRKGIALVILLVISTFLGGADLYRKNVLYVYYKPNYQSPLCYVPFYLPQEVRHTTTWLKMYSIHHSVPATLPTIALSALIDACTDTEVTLNTADKQTLSAFIQPTVSDTLRPQYNLLFILIESLESFALETQDINGYFILPHLRNFSKSSSVLYADKLTSQAKHGVSSDGQMIYQTGLLPLQHSAAAMTCVHNIYPNYAHLYDTSILSNPEGAYVWNQIYLTPALGYKEMLGGDQSLSDEEIFHRLAAWNTPLNDSTACYLAITSNSHSPFKRIPTNPTLHFDTNIPQMMRDYLTCLHYTDSCFGAWYNEWKNTEQAKNTILVITSDHTIFKDATLQELLPYAQEAGLSIASGETYCPLIIQAPQINNNIHLADVCYQMDVFPTIMHLIGCEDYFWKGFGVNLLDSVARENRPISEKDAYLLSDKLIQSDYFRTVVDSLLQKTL